LSTREGSKTRNSGAAGAALDGAAGEAVWQSAGTPASPTANAAMSAIEQRQYAAGKLNMPKL
jgi:hypothetical protein